MELSTEYYEKRINELEFQNSSLQDRILFLRKSLEEIANIKSKPEVLAASRALKFDDVMVRECEVI